MVRVIKKNTKGQNQVPPSHAEEINRVLFAIADAVNSTQDLDALYRTIHHILGTVIDVTNFFIAIVDRKKRTLFFPYWTDSVDDDFSPISDFDTSSSLTGLVVTAQKPILLRAEALRQRAAQSGVWGPVPAIWMGVPLIIRDEVIGVIAVQNYVNANGYTEEDLQLLTAVSQQTAIAIDRKRSLTELQRSEETYRNIFLNAQVGIFRTTLADGILEECNDAMARMLGYDRREECISRYSLKDNHVDFGAWPRMEKILRQGGEVRNYEARVQRKDGTNVWFRYSAKVQEMGQWLEGVAEDISDFKATQEEKQKLQERLTRSKKMEALGLLAGGVAHDLNNMLAGIINYPEIMLMRLDPDRDDKLIPLVKATLDAGKRIAMVVDDLLTLSRSAASVREIHSVNSLVHDYLVSPESMLLQERYPGVVIRTRLDAANPTISCSPVHVRKCLMNLVTNAVEAISEDGTVVIATDKQSPTADIDGNAGNAGNGQPPEAVTITVSDTGKGIAVKDLEHIFEPFYTRKVMGKSGTGLGLAVVWNTMQDHQGAVTVASSTQGTVFTLLFPLARGIAKSGDQQFDPEKCQGRGESILVVDDEPQLRDVACHMLNELGYVAHHVSSGEEAVAFIKNNKVALILLDMLMGSGCNGRQAYEEIVKIRPGQKAIIASGYSESDDVKASLQLGVGRFLKKPYTFEQLYQAVRDELAR